MRLWSYTVHCTYIRINIDDMLSGDFVRLQVDVHYFHHVYQYISISVYQYINDQPSISFGSVIRVSCLRRECLLYLDPYRRNTRVSLCEIRCAYLSFQRFVSAEIVVNGTSL